MFVLVISSFAVLINDSPAVYGQFSEVYVSVRNQEALRCYYPLF